MRSLLALPFLLGGCDAVFGLSGSDLPACSLGAFSGATGTQIAIAFTFSQTEDGAFAVADRFGTQFVIEDGVESVLDVPFFAPAVAIAVFPEGDRVLLSFAIEEPEVRVARRVDATQWVFAPAPRGVYAGTPAEEKHDSRVLVRLSLYDGRFQEYLRDENDEWQRTGSELSLPAVGAPNLSANALTLTFEHVDGGVFAAQRDAVGSAFREPVKIFDGPGKSPQLSADCSELVVTQREPGEEEGRVLRFSR
jgi:hypothetical protein